jgi:hypothetical protein
MLGFAAYRPKAANEWSRGVLDQDNSTSGKESTMLSALQRQSEMLPTYARHSPIQSSSRSPKSPRCHRFLAGFTIAIFVAESVTGCITPDGPTLDSILKSLSGQVIATLDSAAADAKAIVTSTGSDINRLIDGARVSYEDSMDKTLDRVDASASARIEQIKTLVNDFVNHAADRASDLQSQAQSIILTLPFANGQPQVRSWSPHFITTTSAVAVIVDGIFTESQQSGSEVSLEINGKTLRSSSGANTTQKQIFTVAAQDFGTPAPTSVTPVTATLIVPYFSPILHIDKTARYTLLFGALPSSPGSFRVRSVTHNTVREEQNKTSQIIHQAGGDNVDVTQTYCTDTLPNEPNEPLWRIAAFPSVAFPELFHLDGSAGNESNPGDPRKENVAWSKKYTNVGAADKQCAEVWTRSYSNSIIPPGHHSGDITFHLQWTIERTVDKPFWTESNPDILAWGDRRALKLMPGEWEILYQPFQGPAQEITGDYKSDWLTVSIVNQDVTIQTLAPDQVRF